jgi:hypothetical protein
MAVTPMARGGIFHRYGFIDVAWAVDLLSAVLFWMVLLFDLLHYFKERYEVPPLIDLHS